MPEIILDRVRKQFTDGTVILTNASFTIHDGEFFILVGPSGCGKSTLLNLIVGLEAASSGEIRIDGQVINELDPKDRNMAMVFQSYAIYPHMTVRENIGFPLRLAGLPKAEIARKVEETAAILELGELLERKPASLSGGQRQRVAMGRALIRNPVAFLLDEPLSNLDARLRVQMRFEIGRLQKQLGTTMIYVTHDQTEAMTLGDRVAVLSQGEVQQIGTPQQLYHEPANLFVAGFIGSPGMNFLPAEIKGSRLVLPIGETELPQHFKNRLPANVGKCIAGFRPEAIRCANTGDNTSQDIGFQAKIDVVEWLGAELFIYFNVILTTAFGLTSATSAMPDLQGKNKITLVCRLDPSVSINKEEELVLLLNCLKIHFFDGETGYNLLSNN
jgi:multiple sugar transport system ATP-binding protein